MAGKKLGFLEKKTRFLQKKTRFFGERKVLRLLGF